MNKLSKWFGSSSFYFLASALAIAAFLFSEDVFSEAVAILMFWITISAADTNKKLEDIKEHLGIRDE